MGHLIEILLLVRVTIVSTQHVGNTLFRLDVCYNCLTSSQHDVVYDNWNGIYVMIDNHNLSNITHYAAFCRDIDNAKWTTLNCDSPMNKFVCGIDYSGSNFI